jgi:hypothetical protein
MVGNIWLLEPLALDQITLAVLGYSHKNHKDKNNGCRFKEKIPTAYHK